MLRENDQTDKIPATCCYFSISPSMPSSTTFPLETPLYSPDFVEDLVTPDPTHPLLASRPTTISSPECPKRPLPTMNASKLLQLQTQAAHPKAVRPQPRPLQDMFNIYDDTEATSDDSIDSNTSDDAASSAAPVLQHARCSRCQRDSSIDLTTGRSNMVQWGVNSFYCNRCAKIVGFGHR